MRSLIPVRHLTAILLMLLTAFFHAAPGAASPAAAAGPVVCDGSCCGSGCHCLEENDAPAAPSVPALPPESSRLYPGVTALPAVWTFGLSRPADRPGPGRRYPVPAAAQTGRPGVALFIRNCAWLT